VSTEVVASGRSRHRVVIEFSSRHVRSDTLRSTLSEGGTHSVIAKYHTRRDNTLVFHPLVIGFPWLAHSDEHIASMAMWHCREFFENFVEDFDEFDKVASVPRPAMWEEMRSISENAFRACLTTILGDTPSKDWGGETSDHFTASLHLKGRRLILQR
jgi:hypothetical protein